MCGWMRTNRYFSFIAKEFLIFAIYKIISGYDCLMRLKRGRESDA